MVNTESREQRAVSSEQRTENREQRAKSKEQIKMRVLFLSVFVLVFVFVASCHLDIFGSFSSSELEERLKAKNEFNFLKGKTTDRKDEAPVKKNWLTALSELPEQYSFVIVSDTHIEDGDSFDFDKLPGVIKKYNDAAVISGSPKIEFVAVLGDITQYGTEQDIRTFIDIAEDPKNGGIPYYPVIGNHDFYFDNWPNWRGLIGSTNYKIEGRTAETEPPHTTFFVLDSANSFFGKEQLDWLESELFHTKGQRVFVLTHSPLFVDGPVNMQQVTDTRERARIISILNNKCNIMFMGHMHKRREDKVNGVRYVAIEDFRTKNVYCIVTVKDSGITYKFKEL
jgi:predicted phosphodiesterase